MGSYATIKKPGGARLSSPHAHSLRCSSRARDDRSFLLPGAIALVQHSNDDRRPKIVVMQKISKINVPKKQQARRLRHRQLPACGLQEVLGGDDFQARVKN
jgi:hypothetical protein